MRRTTSITPLIHSFQRTSYSCLTDQGCAQVKLVQSLAPVKTAFFPKRCLVLDKQQDLVLRKQLNLHNHKGFCTSPFDKKERGDQIEWKNQDTESVNSLANDDLFDRGEKKAIAAQIFSLFSVDQIREQESPWKALVDVSNLERPARRASPFKKRLQECKKIRMLYGNLPRRVLNHYFKEIHKPEDLLLLLESRLDIVLKRSALFPSIQSARRSILQGGVAVNGTVTRSPRYHCTPGDYIEIIQRSVLRTSSLLQAKNLHPGKQRKDHLNRCNSFQDLFTFSELLQLFDRRTGRLHTSIHSDLQSTSLPFFMCDVEKCQNGTSKTTNRTSKNRATTSFQLSKKQKSRDHDATTEKWDANIDHNPSGIVANKMMAVEGLNRISTNATIPQAKLVVKPVTGEKIELERPLARTISSRPLHLEVSYRNLSVIYLYPPQRICLDVSIDLFLLC